MVIDAAALRSADQHGPRRRLLCDPRLRARITVRAVLITLVLLVPLYLALLALVWRSEADGLERDLAREGRRVGVLVREGRLDSDISGESHLLQVVDPGRRVVAAVPAMRGRPAVNFPEPDPDDDRRDGTGCAIDAPGGPCFRVVALRVGGGADRRVVYAVATEPGWLPRPGLALALALGVPLIAGLVGLGAWRSAGRALAPVAAIRRELDEITATDLRRRVPEPPRRDEVHLLARSVNATLDRLEKAVARQRAFVSDVSHELRSPLTGLRMELELALADPRAADVPDALAAMLRNADRLQAIMDDLLALARLESDHRPPAEPVDLNELTDQEVLRRPRRARVTIEATGPVLACGTRVELARVLTNLIDNADRHADAAVTVRVLAEGDRAFVEVVDDGTGVRPEDRDRIFERFARLAEGRHRDAGGTGLGLAISRDIAEAHGGELYVTERRDGRPGARFVLALPRAEESGPSGPAGEDPEG